MNIGRRHKLSCPRHRGLKPYDRGTVKGGCVICSLICDAWEHAEKLDKVAERIQQILKEREEWKRKRESLSMNPRTPN